MARSYSAGFVMQFDKIRNSLFSISLLASPAVFAEDDPLIFLDVFGGYSWSQDQTVEIDTTLLGSAGSFDLEDLDVHNGPSFGGRIGMWLKTHPSIGLAVDVTRFDTDINNQVSTASNIVSATPLVGVTTGTTDIRITNVLVSFDLILRHRGERFTPYIMGGPGDPAPSRGTLHTLYHGRPWHHDHQPGRRTIAVWRGTGPRRFWFRV